MKKQINTAALTVIMVCVMVLSGSVAGLITKDIKAQIIFKSVSLETQNTVKAFARKKFIFLFRYPEEILQMLERNKETEEFVLNYPIEKNKKHVIDESEFSRDEVPLFIQWDKRWGYLEFGSGVAGYTACGPICLSMVAYYFTGDRNVLPDKILDFTVDNGYYLKGTGARWSLFTDGGERLGLKVEEIPIEEADVKTAMEGGKVIIASMDKGDFTTKGHFIVFVDYSEGLLKVNDPNSYIRSNKKWEFSAIKDQIKCLWSIEKKEIE